jgi:hypothetical protein
VEWMGRRRGGGGESRGEGNNGWRRQESAGGERTPQGNRVAWVVAPRVEIWPETNLTWDRGSGKTRGST